MKWINQVALQYEGGECLVWPFGFDAHGYCIVRIAGRSVYAHRYICEQVYGPPPTARAEVAHSCGNGSIGCLAKKHLRWATHADNMNDRFEHGWSHRGERHASASLSNAQALEIDALLRDGMLSKAAIARMYEVGPWVISDIASGKNWAKVISGEAA